MTARIGDEIVIVPRGQHQPVREGEIREVREDSDGVVYLVRWSDTGYESVLRPGPDAVIKHAPGGGAVARGGALSRSLLWHPLGWLHRRGTQREQQARDDQLAGRLEQIIAGLRLTHITFSIGAGRTVHVPNVISVTSGPPVGLVVRMLPGQTPHDFAAHAPAIAYNLGVAQVLVVPLGPSRIRIDLLPQDALPDDPP